MNYLTRREWTDRAAAHLAGVMGADAAVIEAEVLRGLSELFETPGGGLVVTRIDELITGRRELVIVAANGTGAGDAGMNSLIDAAQHSDIDAVRVHSRRRGMGRYLSRWGFCETERTYSLELGRGRKKQ